VRLIKIVVGVVAFVVCASVLGGLLMPSGPAELLLVVAISAWFGSGVYRLVPANRLR
jgi:hypothetical protein